MKMAMTALTVVLLASAASAQAQPGSNRDRGDRADRQGDAGARGPGERRGDASERPQRDWTSERPGRNVVRDVPRRRETPQAESTPQVAPAPAVENSGPRGDRLGRDGDRRPDRGAEARDNGRRGDGDDRRDARDGDRRWDERRADDGRRYDGRRDDGRRDNGHWNDRRRNDRWADRRFDRYPRWERGRYATIYVSPSRYRYAWRPPYGYYSRSWGFGDLLPRGWYGPSYAILDPWRFDLPLPPPGFDWVRAGDDALLVDQFNGRIVQVVRNIFW